MLIMENNVKGKCDPGNCKCFVFRCLRKGKEVMQSSSLYFFIWRKQKQSCAGDKFESKQTSVNFKLRSLAYMQQTRTTLRFTTDAFLATLVKAESRQGLNVKLSEVQLLRFRATVYALPRANVNFTHVWTQKLRDSSNQP